MVVMRNSRKIDDCVAWWWYMVLLAVAWFSRQANCLPHVFPQQGCSIKLLHSQHTKPGGCFVLVSFLSESGHMLYALLSMRFAAAHMHAWVVLVQRITRFLCMNTSDGFVGAHVSLGDDFVGAHLVCYRLWRQSKAVCVIAWSYGRFVSLRGHMAD